MAGAVGNSVTGANALQEVRAVRCTNRDLQPFGERHRIMNTRIREKHDDAANVPAGC
jgi:hypothetical protein